MKLVFFIGIIFLLISACGSDTSQSYVDLEKKMNAIEQELAEYVKKHGSQNGNIDLDKLEKKIKAIEEELGFLVEGADTGISSISSRIERIEAIVSALLDEIKKRRKGNENENK